MGELEEKLAKSLTGQTTKLLPYLPYLLQDLWELGAMPGDILALLRAHAGITENARVLDLACGKGAVGIRLAQALHCRVKGIDLIPEFIETAQYMAGKHGVDALCAFETGDILQAVERERGYDAAILAAVGDVIGDPLTTLKKLRQTVLPGGVIVIDDAYALEETDTDCYTKENWMKAFEEANVVLLAEQPVDLNELEKMNAFNQTHIERRAEELKRAHPELSDLFDRYVEDQRAECEDLMQDIVGVTWLLGVRR